MTGFPSDLFAGKRYAVVGLGRAGLAAMRALTAMGASVVGWDDAAFARDAAMRDEFFVRDPANDIADFDALVLSPGIPHKLPVPHRIAAAAQQARVPIYTDAELLFQAVRGAGSAARFAGITGTNGKSTTTALLAHILKAAGVPCAAGANLGPAALSLPLLPDDGVYVLEMSSYMLERLHSLRFGVAVMLNISPDHLDRHGDMAGYAAAKREIFARQRLGDVAILGVDDDACVEMAGQLSNPMRISGHAPADLWCCGSMLRDQSGDLADLSDARALPGTHNAQNAAAAAAAAMALGVSRADVSRGLLSFAGLPHRQELVGSRDGVRFINDSKATNADATARALACYGTVIWIAGGIAKDGGIASLAPLFDHVALALLIGRDAGEFATTLAGAGVAYQVVETLDRAVPAAWQAARLMGVDCVLLSPACASFDQFSGFEARGDSFRSLVVGLASAGGGVT